MEKILVVSDNHGRTRQLDELKKLYNSFKYKVHLGDSELSADYLKDFITVRGNNDFGGEFEKYVIFEVEGHRILAIHGDRYVYGTHRELLVSLAKENYCDMVLFGHTHVFEYQTIAGVHLINPGSLSYNRDRSPISYAVVSIDGNKIKVERKNI